MASRRQQIGKILITGIVVTAFAYPIVALLLGWISGREAFVRVIVGSVVILIIFAAEELLPESSK